MGLSARSGELVKKPWRVCTNDEHILIPLRPLQCSNTSDPVTDHKHAECKGVDRKESESYTFKYIRIVHIVGETQQRARPTLNIPSIFAMRTVWTIGVQT